ncbi:LPD3 domain-containing protein, partial [Prosthecobacter dejongeii]
TTRETLIELAVRDTLQRDRSGQPTGHAAGSLTQALDTAIVGATRAEDARSFSQLRAYFRAEGTRVRGVLGTLGQLKRAQAQGHLPAGGDWAQYVDTLLGLTPGSSSLQGRPIAPGTALNTGPTFSLTFKNLDQAEQHLRSFSGKPLTTADGLTANVSNQTAAKMASGSAVKKSADIRAHLAAIENFETLFQTGKVIESNPDRAEDLNITAIHRVHSRMEIENTAYNVKFTVKELLHPLTNRIYSIEAMELESAPPAGLLVHDTFRLPASILTMRNLMRRWPTGGKKKARQTSSTTSTSSSWRRWNKCSRK